MIGKNLFNVIWAATLIIPSVSYGYADLLLLNGKIFTAEKSRAHVQALAVKDGKVLQVGDVNDLKALAGPDTKIIELDGKRVMPGIVDSHSHAIFGGIQLASASMQDEQVSVPELAKRLTGWRDDGRAVHGDILMVTGMHSGYWSYVDEFSGIFNQGDWAQTPIVFLGSDYHTAWVNQAMLKQAKIDQTLLASLASNERHTIGIREDGKPNGLLIDAGWDRVSKTLPKLTDVALLAAAKSAVAYNNSLGITAWMDPATNAAPGEGLFALQPTEDSVGILPAYKALADQGGLTAHVAALLVAPSKSVPADLEVLDVVRQKFLGTPNLTLPGIKIFADGVIEYPAQSAALLGHYHNRDNAGELLIDPQQFGQLISAADKKGWLVQIHAIGDLAVRESLNGIAQARKDRDSGIPHSITHLQVVNPEDFGRFKALDVIASMQLLWATADHYTVDLIKPYIDAEAFQYQYPAHSLHANGAMIAGASDWPISGPNPWHAIYQAISRVGPHGILNAEERLDRETMFYAYTINAAKAIGLDGSIGSLTAGKQADFLILDRDVFDIDGKDIEGTQVLETYFAGKQVYALSKAN